MKRTLIIGTVALIVGAFGSPSSGFADLDSALVGYWSFDEGDGGVAHDYSGNGNDGTIHGATWTTGVVGSALHFDGDDDHVNCGNNAIFDMDYPVTLVAWISKEPGGGFEGQGNVGIITTDRAPLHYSGYILETHRLVDGNNPLSAGIGDGTGGGYPAYRRSKVSPPIIEHYTWHHVVGVIRGPMDMNLYVNAVDVGGSYTGGGEDVAWLGGPCVIGCSWYFDYYFKGIIDEVRIYNRELGEREIESLFCQGPHVCFVRGDVEADADHDIFDALYLLNWLGGINPAPSCKLTTDAQDDGDADLFDALHLLNWLGGVTPPPPAPCCGIPDGCGLDPTPNDPTNELDCNSYPPCE